MPDALSHAYDVDIRHFCGKHSHGLERHRVTAKRAGNHRYYGLPATYDAVATSQHSLAKCGSSALRQTLMHAIHERNPMREVCEQCSQANDANMKFAKHGEMWQSLEQRVCDLQFPRGEKTRLGRTDLAPAQTTATGVRPSSVKSALTSNVDSAPLWTPPMPPVTNTRMPAMCATIIVAATVIAPFCLRTIVGRISLLDTLLHACPALASETSCSPERPTQTSPARIAIVAGVAPCSLTVASTLLAVSRFCGNGMPESAPVFGWHEGPIFFMLTVAGASSYGVFMHQPKLSIISVMQYKLF